MAHPAIQPERNMFSVASGSIHEGPVMQEVGIQSGHVDVQGKRRGGQVDAVVGQTIRLLRLQKRLSQTALAQKIGVSFQQVQKYENGTNRVGASRMVQIAQALRVPLDSLFQRVDGAQLKAEHRDEDPLALISNSQALRVARAFSTISNNQVRIAIVALLESIAERER